MPLVRKLSQIGNSKGLILPQTVLEILGWLPDTELELKIVGPRLILSPTRRTTGEEFKAATDDVFTKRGGLMEKLANGEAE